MKQKREFRPQDLRNILAVIFVVILVGGIAIFYLALDAVKTYSTEVYQALVDSDANSKHINELRALKTELSQSDSVIQKANQVFATPDTYRNQVQTDIKRYTDAAGLSINHMSFKEGSEQYTITVALSSPASYTKLITFLNNIETNLPKLLVSSISLRTGDTANADSVGVGDIEISVLVR